MSVKLMAKAWEMDLSQGEKLVLLALCDHANDDGVCYPSQEYLAQKCSMSPRSLIDQINKLKKYGILTAERRQKSGGRLANLYVINLDNFSQSANSAPAKSACENSAPAKSAPTNVQITAELPAKSAPSFKEEPSKNHQLEPSIYTHPPADEKEQTTGEKKLRVWAEGLSLLTDKGVDEQVAKDFIAIRKSQKAPLTMTALGRIEREATKAGLTLEGVIRLCAEKGWRGFEASWLQEYRNQPQPHKPSVKDVPVHTEGGRLSW
jgi:hypothetical protein